MKFLVLFLTLSLSMIVTPAFAYPLQTQAQVKAQVFGLNKASPGAMATYQLGSLVNASKHVLVGKYTAAAGQLTFGTARNLKDAYNNSLRLPKGAIVSDCLLDFSTAFTSGGSLTVSIGTGQAANDLKSALAVASATGLVACIPVGSAATAIKLTADRTPTITFGVADLLTGAVTVYIEYWMAE